MRALWHDILLAESDNCVNVEGNYYFPPQDVRMAYLQPSDTRTECSWKGTAHYYDVVTDSGRNPDAAWSYPNPFDAARHIAGHIAFWKGVEIQE